MDPNETLRQLRRLAEYGRQLERPDANAGDGYGGYTWRQLAHEQAELLQALDEWLSKDGFLPDAWAPYGQPPRPWAGLHQSEPEHLIASTAPTTSKETHQS